MGALSFSGPNSSLYGWLIGLVIALGLAGGAYLFFEWLRKYTLAQQEKTANSIFAPVLPLGETLLAFTQGYTGPGRTGMVLLFGALGDAIINAPRRKWYYVGVTRQSLLLVQVKGKKPTGVQQVLPRREVSHLSFESGVLKEPKLILQFAVESIELRVNSSMVKRAKEVDAAWRSAL